MTKEEVKLIVLATMEEIVIDPLEKNKITSRLETARYEMSLQRARRRELLLALILCFTVGIFLSLVCVSAQASSVQPKHQADAPSAAAKPWWKFFFEKPAEKHFP
jgi:hypothetical protein